MKTECIKLEAYIGEQVMTIAPYEIMGDFLVFLEVMAIDARDMKYSEGKTEEAQFYEDFRKQLHMRSEEIYEVHN